MHRLAAAKRNQTANRSYQDPWTVVPKIAGATLPTAANLDAQETNPSEQRTGSAMLSLQEGEIEIAFSADADVGDTETIDYMVIGWLKEGDDGGIDWVPEVLLEGTISIGPRQDSTGVYNAAESITGTTDNTRNSSFGTIGGGTDRRQSAAFDASGFKYIEFRFAPPSTTTAGEIRLKVRRLT